MLVSAGIALVLGCLHLAYTLTGSRLLPRDAALQSAMEQAHLSITRETTVYRAWIGFNASHSLALILFALVFGHLALQQPRLLFESNFLLAVGFALLAGFCVLARLYWFSIPFAGVTIALLCYAVSVVVAKVA
jgi:hypothetical protein